MDQLLNKEQYCNTWMEESEIFRKKMVYQWLTNFTPNGNILELGCGSGQGTYQLLKKHQVLSLDNNDFLINEAAKLIKEQAKIHKCNFLELTQEDKNIIKDFAPKVIVGWFLGSDGEEVEKYTDKGTNSEEKWDQYRKKIEDIITSPDICTPSVEYIHLANRNIFSSNYNEQKTFAATKKEYDTSIFSEINFEVVDVKIMAWPTKDSHFQYIGNQYYSNENSFKAIVSILARRKAT